MTTPIQSGKSLRWLLPALLLPLAMSGRAAPVEVPDPVAFARLSISQQEAIRADLDRQIQAATPQERSQFRNAVRQSIEKLTPGQRREIEELARRRWQELSPQQRERVAQQRREWVEKMSPEERTEAIEQRRKLLETLSPAERTALEQPLQPK